MYKLLGVFALTERAPSERICWFLFALISKTSLTSDQNQLQINHLGTFEQYAVNSSPK